MTSLHDIAWDILASSGPRGDYYSHDVRTAAYLARRDTPPAGDDPGPSPADVAEPDLPAGREDWTPGSLWRDTREHPHDRFTLRLHDVESTCVTLVEHPDGGGPWRVPLVEFERHFRKARGS